MLLIDFGPTFEWKVKVFYICIFCCKNVNQLLSLSWTPAIASEYLEWLGGGIRFILWQLTSHSARFNCHVVSVPPVKAAVCQFSSISSPPPGAHLAAACCANGSNCSGFGTLSANQSLPQSLLLCWESLEETSSPPHRTPLLRWCLLFVISRSLLLPRHPNYNQKPFAVH